MRERRISMTLFLTSETVVFLLKPQLFYPILCVYSNTNGYTEFGADYIFLCPRQSLAVNIHCEFLSRFHSDSKRIRSGFESKRRESPRIHNVFAQQYGFANFGRVFTVIHCETLSWD